ncbi:TPA: hypothetical protein I8231_003882 [Citrobacter freundii]|nr:hypothetical protein [Citrobacter freundii]HAT2234098.1 hypothetical protein [Citrobacter freundii]HAT2239411.1 hypothetical protein [Citrobacter freundii]HAT2411989.1 hypothetical protein [Citrobacter freundii]HAT2427554.1 hypothetical protein [Citrobacter freundii]
MSVPNQTPYIIYNANGLTTVFPFEFYIISASDIQVSINGTVITSGYTVSGVGNVSGGDLTFLTPPANGAVVMLERVVPTYRLTDYQDNGDLLADTVNKDFDRLWMAIQRSFIYLGLALRRPLLGGPFNAEGYRIENLADPVNDQDAASKKYVQQVGQTNLNRTVRVPESYVAPVPALDIRRNKLFAWDGVGNPICVLPESGSAADVMIQLAKPEGLSNIGTCPDVSILRTLSVPPGRKVMLLGYHTDYPGVGGGILYASNDTSLSDDGVRVFVTTDGTRLIRETNGELYASWAGAIGDWNGTTGTDNKAAIERLISAAGTNYRWVVDTTNVGVSSIVIDNKNGWNGHIQGSVINISSKPAPGAVDRKDQDGGVLPTFKITNCSNWTFTGSFVDNRYREAFYIEYCDYFELGCANLGSGINDNLTANHFRYCNHFSLSGVRVEKSGVIPSTGYYDWVQALRFWDCSGFILSGIVSRSNAGNGIYIGSNCKDYIIDNFDLNSNGMSGIQLAWSSFGVFPVRGVISNGTISGNRADAIDVNNTSGAQVRVDLNISGVTSVANGYNTDGTVTADGSGLGTFIQVSHFSISDSSANTPARAGFFASHCSHFDVQGSFIKKDQTSNSLDHGVYMEHVSNFSLNVDVITDSANAGMYSLRLYGEISNGKISGNYTGNGFIGNDATYVNTVADFAYFISPSVVTVPFMFRNSTINVASGIGASIASSMDNCRVVSNSGHGATSSASGVSVTNCEFIGTDSGLYFADGVSHIRATGSSFTGSSGPGLRINTGAKHMVQGCFFKSGAGNSIVLTGASAVVYVGNDDSSNPTNFTGTTFTLNN